MEPEEREQFFDLVERQAGRPARRTVEGLVAQERSRINHLLSPICRAAGYTLE